MGTWITYRGIAAPISDLLRTLPPYLSLLSYRARS
jgi:hypothetical protein